MLFRAGFTDGAAVARPVKVREEDDEGDDESKAEPESEFISRAGFSQDSFLVDGDVDGAGEQEDELDDLGGGEVLFPPAADAEHDHRVVEVHGRVDQRVQDR